MQTFYHISRRYGGDYPRKRQQFQVDDYFFALTISCAARRASAREVVRREWIRRIRRGSMRRSLRSAASRLNLESWQIQLPGDADFAAFVERAV